MGLMVFPTGNGSVMILPTSDGDSKPTAYSTRFETDDGVMVDVKFNTGDQNVANTLQNKLAEHMGWKVSEEAPPMSLASMIFTIWGMAFLLAFLIAFGGIFLFIMLHAAGMISFQDSEAYIPMCIRLGIVAFPVTGFIGTIVALITHRRN